MDDKASTYSSKGTFDGTGMKAGGPAADGKFDITVDGKALKVDLSAAAAADATQVEVIAALQATLNAELGANAVKVTANGTTGVTF